jgi:transposase
MRHNRNPKPPYPPQFRQQMVELVAAGRKPSELAKEFGCHETSILSWLRRAAASVESSASAAPGLHANERAELIALRRKLRQVQQERDILAKACDHGLQAKASRRPQRLHADSRQPGRTIRSCHVQTPQSLHQRLLRLAGPRAEQAGYGQCHVVGAH